MLLASHDACSPAEANARLAGATLRETAIAATAIFKNLDIVSWSFV
jgi:hypothetical protein